MKTCNLKTQRVISAAALLAILPAVLLLAGCPLAGGDRWDRCATLSQDFGHAMSDVQDVEIAGYNAGKVADEDHVAVQQAFIEAATDGKALDAAIREGRNAKNATEKFSATLAAIKRAQDAGLAHIKNADLRAQVQLGLLTAKSFLDTMEVTARQ